MAPQRQGGHSFLRGNGETTHSDHKNVYAAVVSAVHGQAHRQAHSA
eukprot:COSAG01_NODE_6011_length_3902_cov_10.567447_5_plen_46_part_00